MTAVIDDPPVPVAHVVHFYDDEAQLVSVSSAFIGQGLAAGDGALIVATAPHREAIRGELLAGGHQLAHLGELEASQTLARVQGPSGRLAEDRFVEVLGTAITHVSRSSPTGTVRVFGEMVALLSSQGEPAEALVMEDLCNRLPVGDLTVALLCGYPTGSVSGEWLDAVHARHTAVLP